MIILIIVLLAPLLLLLPIVNACDYEPDNLNLASTYVVLGNKSKNSVPSRDMRARMIRLFNLNQYSQHKATIILTGANGEAELMHNLINWKGHLFPENLYNIVEDRDSINTVQSIQYLVNNEVHNAIVITSAYHVLRTRILARKFGCDCIVVPTLTHEISVLKFAIECYFVVGTWLIPMSFYMKLHK